MLIVSQQQMLINDVISNLNSYIEPKNAITSILEPSTTIELT